LAYLLSLLIAASLPWQAEEQSGPTPGQLAKEYWAGFGAAAAFGLAGASCIASVYTFHGGEAKVTGLDPLGYSLLAVMPAAAALTTTLVDLGSDPRGSVWGALAGSYAGALVGGGLFYGLLAMRGSIGNEPHCVAGVLAPFIVASGGVIGYNLSRPCRTCDESFGSRLGPPSVWLAASDLGNGQTGIAADLRLVSLRF
jgi:hypothetical protein